MDNATPSERPAPARTTLADLLALIAGVAIVLALPWLNQFEFLKRSWGRPGSYPLLLDLVQEALGKVTLVFVPVILTRAARRGEMVRPAAFLLACLGLPWLAQGIHDRILLGWLATRFGRANMLNISVVEGRWFEENTGWIFTIGWLILTASAIVLVRAGRRRWAGWLRSLLVMIAWLGLFQTVTGLTWHHLVSRLHLHLLMPPGHDLANEAVFAIVLNFPPFLLYSVTAAAALLGPGRSWLKWAALGLAGASSLVTEARVLIINQSNSPRALFWAIELTRFLTLIGAVALGVLIVRRLAPAWRRWLGPGYDGSST